MRFPRPRDYEPGGGQAPGGRRLVAITDGTRSQQCGRTRSTPGESISVPFAGPLSAAQELDSVFQNMANRNAADITTTTQKTVWWNEVFLNIGGGGETKGTDPQEEIRGYTVANRKAGARKMKSVYI